MPEKLHRHPPGGTGPAVNRKSLAAARAKRYTILIPEVIISGNFLVRRGLIASNEDIR